ncbi:hypothetical protein Q1695_015592 [Nippostrongylus brasiliensis]|nr:hypothetical protein Q1695_015592 [Nippostrongylus brasiliensis]
MSVFPSVLDLVTLSCYLFYKLPQPEILKDLPKTSASELCAVVMLITGWGQCLRRRLIDRICQMPKFSIFQ